MRCLKKLKKKNSKKGPGKQKTNLEITKPYVRQGTGKLHWIRGLKGEAWGRMGHERPTSHIDQHNEGGREKKAMPIRKTGVRKIEKKENVGTKNKKAQDRKQDQPRPRGRK